MCAGLVLLLCAGPVRAMNSGDANNLALSLLTQSGRHCALIAVPHCGSGELAVGFWNQGGDARMLVDAFECDPALLASAQQKASALGLLGRNLYVRSGTLSTNAYALPYADNICDLLCITRLADTNFSTISYAEVERVLCTGAKAWIGRAAAEGDGLSADTLTNWIHAAGTRMRSSAAVITDANGTWAVITKISRMPNTYEGPCDTGGGSRNNAGSAFYSDKLAAWPNLPQFFVKPLGTINSGGQSKVSRWGVFSSICVGGGRMYGFDRSTLCALRVQNGQLLWQRAGLSGNIQPYLNGLVYNNRQILDGETGTNTTTIPLPGGTVSWSAVEKDIYYAVMRSGSVNTLFAYNLTNNTILYSNAGFAGNSAVSSVVISGCKIYTYYSTSVYCYNALNGAQTWGPVTAPSFITRIKGASVGVLLDTGSNLSFLSATDGTILWGPKSYSARRVDIGQSDYYNNSNEFVLVEGGGYYDLMTGASVSTGPWYGGGACQTAASITPAGTYGRRGGMAFSFAIGAGVNTSDPYASTCGDAPFAASGLTFYGCKSDSCSCYSMFRGTASESAMGAFNPEQAAVEADRLLQGPAYTNLVAQVNPDAKDWPTHRANISRSGSTAARVATNNCVQLWKYTNPTTNTYNKDLNDHFYTYFDVTPPVTVGRYTYLAGSDGVVKCLDNNTGSNLWNYATGGWIFSTPTVANGCVYVGSGDGCAYCLEAHTGRLVWRFRAAPAEYRFNYYGHLISAWPILGGVLVHTNGLAYFVSGLRDTYGVQAFAVDARTGSLTNGWQNTHCGVWIDNRPGIARVGHVPGGYMTIVGNNLWVKESSRGYSTQPQRIGVFDLQTGALTTNDTSCAQHSENGGGFWTGRQIGLMSNYVLNWGEDIHTEMDIEMYGGNALYMKTDTNGNMARPFMLLGPYAARAGIFHCPVWDNNAVYYDTYKHDLSVMTQYLNSCSVANYANVYGISDPPLSTDPLWRPAVTSSANRAVALTANCLVEVHTDGVIRVMDRTTGADLFTGSSGGEPYLQAMAVDRTGKIIVANRSGDVTCYGTTAPVIVTPPSNVSGVDAGSPVTFSVEAAAFTGGALTYQWYHNGVQIYHATNATYTINSALSTDTGAYSVTVTNSSGSVASPAASLALAVAAGITVPNSGAVFAEHDDIVISATASSLHGAITNVLFYQGAALIGSAMSSPYRITWSNVAAGSYCLTAVAFDDHGVSGSSIPVNITVASLVSHVTFDETSGTVAHDTSGHTNDAVLMNGGGWTPPNWTSQSLFNGGLHFNNGFNMASLTGVSALTNSALTVSLWMNSDLQSLGGYENLFAFQDSGTNHAMIVSYGSSFQVQWRTTTGTILTSQGHAPAQGYWYHYAVVATPSAVDWYVNGALFAELTPPNGQTMMTSYTNFVVGNAAVTAYCWPYGFQGVLDELKIYDHALGASEIVGLYTNAPYRIPPTISFSNPTNGTVISASNCLPLTVNATVTNGTLRVIYYQNGVLLGTNATAPYSLVWSNVPPGTYTLTAVAQDGMYPLTPAVTATPVTVSFVYATQPTIGLSGGTYLGAQYVTLFCPDPNALIYYTTDGSDPMVTSTSTNGTLISSGASILINQTTFLKVRTFEAGMCPSAIQTAFYRIGGVLAAGSYHSMAATSLGAIWSWGCNFYGQLGNGSYDYVAHSTPICITAMTNVIAMADGSYHSLVVKSDRTVWSFGYNNYGQLGIGSSDYSQHAAITQVSSLADVISVSAGLYHSLALKSDGTVWTWGYNNYGQLGDGGNSPRSVPYQLSSLSNVVAIAAGYCHSLALKSDGSVWAWGYNVNGQLGDGTTTNRSTPVQVGGVGSIVAIAAGNYHNLALDRNGNVCAWGANTYGQLGDGTTTQRTTAVQTGASGVMAIAAGQYHSLALSSNRSVCAWGQNSSGQLGNGTATNTNLPVQVSGLSNVTAIAGCNAQCLALDQNGNVWGWGANGNGQLGFGSTANTNLPTLIPETVQFTVSSQTVCENAGTATITAVVWAPGSQDVTVPFTLPSSYDTAVQGLDYASITASPLTIPAGQSSASITISLINDTTYRGTRHIRGIMGAPGNAILGSITNFDVTMTEDDPLPVAQFMASTQTVYENAGTATIAIQLTPASGKNWTAPVFALNGLSTAAQGVDFTGTLPSSLGYGAGQSSNNFSVVLNNRSGINGSRTMVLTMPTEPDTYGYQLGANSTLTLTILDKEVSITDQPLSQTVNWGQPANFRVAPSGAPPFNYQWLKNGVTISGATGSAYTNALTSVADNGATYTVIVSNAVNCVTSSVANLTVVYNQPPTVNVSVPANGAQFTPPCNLAIFANANADSHGTIQKVDFYNNLTNWLGEVTTLPANPYALTLNNLASGVYNLTAVVTDNQGQTATSSVVQVTVTGTSQPALSIVTACALSTGIVGYACNQILIASGGTPGYTWSVISNGLPAGLGLVAGNGAMTGTPVIACTTNFTALVTDAVGSNVCRVFILHVISAYSQWCVQQFGNMDASTSNLLATPAHDGIANLTKYALGIDPLTSGYQNHLSCGMVNLSGQNCFALSYVRPNPAPVGVTYTVNAADDLHTNAWANATITVSTNINGDGTATITVQDSTISNLVRFLRLLVTENQ